MHVSSGIARWLPQSLGIMIAAAVAGLFSPVRGVRTFPFPEVLLIVATFIPVLAAIALGVATVLHRILTGMRMEVAALQRTAATAACCAPVPVLLRNHSWFAPLGVALLVSSLLLFLRRREGGAAPAKLGSAMWISLLLQIGVAAIAMDQSFIGSILLGLSAAPMVWRASQERVWAGPSAAPFAFAAAFVLLFAALLDNNRIYRIVHAPQPRWHGAAGDPATGISEAERHRAVILIPDGGRTGKPHPGIHSSQRSSVSDGTLVGSREAFKGVYWLLQAPDSVPPERAFTTRGNPRQETFRSMGDANLTMEARQNLARTVDLTTLGGVDVTVDNEEEGVAPILLEVVLIDTKAGRQPFLSLGEQRAEPGVHSLRFTAKGTPVAGRFDEIGIRFRRMTPPYDRSVRASVVQFALISLPR